MEEAHRDGLRHRIVFILVQDPEGRLLLQKRSDNVAVYPGTWDVSAAGHVDEGETYDAAAQRELQEELGLSGFPLQKIDYYYGETITDWRHINRFRTVYRTVIPHDTPLHLSAEEVTGVRWVTMLELQQLVATQPDDIALGLADLVERYYQPKPTDQ